MWIFKCLLLHVMLVLFTFLTDVTLGPPSRNPKQTNIHKCNIPKQANKQSTTALNTKTFHLSPYFDLYRYVHCSFLEHIYLLKTWASLNSIYSSIGRCQPSFEESSLFFHALLGCHLPTQFLGEWLLQPWRTHDWHKLCINNTLMLNYFSVVRLQYILKKCEDNIGFLVEPVTLTPVTSGTSKCYGCKSISPIGPKLWCYKIVVQSSIENPVMYDCSHYMLHVVHSVEVRVC